MSQRVSDITHQAHCQKTGSYIRNSLSKDIKVEASSLLTMSLMKVISETRCDIKVEASSLLTMKPLL